MFKEGFGRRDFLKGAALTVAGAAGAGLLATSTGCSAGGSGTTYEDTISWTHKYDVVVVGFGAAGASTAITAADEGANVLVLEKAPAGAHGSNSIYSGQNVGVAGEATGGEELFAQYYKNMREGFHTPSDEVIDAWVVELANNEEWLVGLTDSCDYKLIEKTEEPEFAPEGVKAMRMGMAMANSVIDGVEIGARAWPILYINVKRRKDMIDVWYGSPAEQLIQDPISKTILGVKVDSSEGTFYVKATNGVVLTCGGYENNPEMLEHFTGFSGVKFIGGPYNNGDGITMCQEIGAKLWHLSNGLLPWFSCSDLRTDMSGMFTNVSIFPPSSYVQVGPAGERFHNEFEKNRHGRVERQGHTVTPLFFADMWHVFDEAARLSEGAFRSQNAIVLSKQLEAEIAEGLVLKANTLEELAELMEVPAENLTNTIATFNGYAASGVDQEFGRAAERMAPFAAAGPYYAWKCVPCVLNTQGGAQRDANCQVLDIYEKPIPKLYSAGEFGFLAPWGYNGGGNYGDCLASGRMAGRNAAAAKDIALPEWGLPGVDQDENIGREDFGQDLFGTFQNTDTEFYGYYVGMGVNTVKVTMDGDKIANVEVVINGDTASIANKTTPLVTAAIVRDQSLAFPYNDYTEGATKSTVAILGATRNAIIDVAPELAATFNKDDEPKYDKVRFT